MNMVVNLVANDYLWGLALEVLRLESSDDFIANEIFKQVDLVIRDSSYTIDKALSYLDDEYYVEFDFISALQNYDTALVTSNYTPRWVLTHENPNIVNGNHMEEVGKDAFIRMTNEDSFIRCLFYYQLLCTTFLGGMGQEAIYDELDHTEFLQPYKELEPKAVAYILQQDYQGVTIKSIPDTVEPIDVSNIPEYLLEGNSQIIMKGTKVYLKVDIEKAITAAGGVAQTLERQDLEGTSDETNEHKSTEQDDNEKTGKSKKASRTKKNT